MKFFDILLIKTLKIEFFLRFFEILLIKILKIEFIGTIN